MGGDLHGLDQAAAARELADAAAHQPVDEPRVPTRLVRLQAAHARHDCLPTKAQFGLPPDGTAQLPGPPATTLYRTRPVERLRSSRALVPRGSLYRSPAAPLSRPTAHAP